MEQFNFFHLSIFISQCVLVAAVLLFLFRLRTVMGTGLLFVALGVLQYMQVFLANSLYVELFPGIMVSSGSAVLFPATLFTVLILYLREGALVTRTAIYAIVVANMLLFLLQFTLWYHIDHPSVYNPYHLPANLFTSNARVLITGTLLLFVDAVLVIVLYEFFSRLSGLLFLRILLTMVSVLSFDAIMFPIGSFWGTERMQELIISGLVSKSAAAVIYTLLFTTYLWVFEKGEMAARGSFRDVFALLSYRQKFEVMQQTRKREQMDAEKAIQQRQQFIEHIIHLSPDVLYIYDLLERKNVFSNNGIQSMLGYSVEEIKAMGDQLIPTLMHPEDFAYYLEHTLPRYAGLKDGEFVEHQYRMQNKNGQWHWLNCKEIIYQRTDEGEPAQILGVVHDISKQKEAELELSSYKDQLEKLVKIRTAELEEANRELESFSYSVSHDLRAPLTRMDGFSKALQQAYAHQLEEKGLHYLSRIRASSQQMAALIDDLLLLSRITTQQMIRLELDVGDIAQDILKKLQDAHPQRRVDWQIGQDLTTCMDPRLARLMMENLLSNAWKYSYNSSPSIIEVGKCLKEGKEWFFVKDNGVGFDMQYAHQLFAPFQRLHAATEVEGSGIGLATVKRIISKHGGQITAESEPGKGAIFFFWLPIYDAQHE